MEVAAINPATTPTSREKRCLPTKYRATAVKVAQVAESKLIDHGFKLVSAITTVMK